MDATTIVLISNTIIMVSTLIATLYRIKIERTQIKLTEKNTLARERLEIIKKLIEGEQNEVINLESKEIREFLEAIIKECGI